MDKFLDSNGLLYYDKQNRVRIDKKVDKVDGKGLSQNDLTNELKTKYDAAYQHSQDDHAPVNAERNTIVGVKVNNTDLAVDAERKVNVTVPTGTLAGKDNVAYTDLDVNLKGRIDALESGTVSVDDTLSNTSTNPVQNKVINTALGTKADKTHTHSDASESASGFMSAVDKTKLNGIEEGANKYIHPSHTAKTNGFYKVTIDDKGHTSAVTPVTKADVTGLGIPAQDTTYTNATQATAGLMSGDDKTKLDAVPAPADIATNTSVAAAVAAAGHIKKTIVETLPVPSEAKDNIIYLVKKTTSATDNAYNEYWLIDGKLELIGDTATKIEAITNQEIDEILKAE